LIHATEHNHYAFHTHARYNAVNYELALARTDSTAHDIQLKLEVTLENVASQADPTNTSPINFTVVFSESVTGFDGTDVSLSGTRSEERRVGKECGSRWNRARAGMTGDGSEMGRVLTTVSAVPAWRSLTAVTS